MDRISLRQALPLVFADREPHPSHVWSCTLDLDRGCSYLIEAESGAGKSSLCSFLYGHRGDYLGTIAIDDEDVRHYSPTRWDALRRSSLAIVWQDLKLFPSLSALDNILLKNRLTQHKSLDEIHALCDTLGLGEHLHRPVGHMSLGQQQRVALVRALCQPFDFIILDEPISHLDASNAEVVAEVVATEASRQSAGIIVTSVGLHLPLPYHHTLTL